MHLLIDKVIVIRRYLTMLCYIMELNGIVELTNLSSV